MFKNLQGLSLLHQLWNGTFSAWMFLKSGNQVGIAFWHCMTAKTTQVHIFMTAIWDKLFKILSPSPLFILHISHNFFQQCQVTSIIFRYKTLSEQTLTAAKGHSSGWNSLRKGNCLFLDFHEEQSCTLQGNSSSHKFLVVHLHNLFSLIGLSLQDTSEDLPNKKDTSR